MNPKLETRLCFVARWRVSAVFRAGGTARRLLHSNRARSIVQLRAVPLLVALLRLCRSKLITLNPLEEV